MFESEDERLVNRSDQENIESEMESNSLSCCKLLNPIGSYETVVDESGDISTRVCIVPEAFRMWFYIGFCSYTAIAIFVSLKWSELDMTDNPIYERFGTSNVCVFYDFPPFSYFSAPLWVPQVINLLLYELFDHYRVHDDFKLAVISKAFFTYYCVVSVLESLIFIFFINITAVTPFENMYLHAIPFVLLTFGLWSLALKRVLYLDKSGFFKTDKDRTSYWFYFAWIYVIVMFFSITVKALIVVPNLFKAYLWTKPGLEWTQPVIQFEGKFWLVWVVFVPMVLYFVFSKDMRTVELVLRRSRPRKPAKQ